MALTFKLLAVGGLTSQTTPLYPPSGATANKMALITSIILVNKDTNNTATITLTLLQQSAGSSRYIAPMDLQLPPRQVFVLDDELTLYLASGPDVINGSSDNTNVDYVINGVERDV